MSLFRHVAALAALACLLAGVATAQTASSAPAPDSPTGSRLLATDHWSYEHIRRLRERGYLANLNPLVRPYRRIEVARGLRSLDPDTIHEPVAGWVRLLREEFWREVDLLGAEARQQWGAMFAPGARASTSQRLDPLRPTGQGHAWPRYNVGAWLETGPLAAETRILGDLYFFDDPDGLDPMQMLGGHPDNAYLSVDFAFGRVIVGSFKRDWSALGARGLMVSDNPTSYPQVGIEFGLGHFALRAFTGELDTIGGQKRYIAAQRVDYATDRWVVSFGQAILYAVATGGPRLRFFNPAGFLFFEADDEPADVVSNLVLEGQVWYHRGRVVLWGAAMLDDIDVDPEGQDRAPTRYAFTIGGRWTPRAKPFSLSAEYQQVSSFAYRNSAVVDHYSYLERGLGEKFADYDRLTLATEIYPPLPGLTLTPTFQLQRQAEGDLRVPFPPYAVFRASPSLFLGVRETTYRLGLRGWYQPRRFFWVTWDVGQNFVRNAGHVTGVNRSEFSAVAQLGVRLDFPSSRPR